MIFEDTVTSGKLCKMTNISRRTLRWWLEKGLLEHNKNTINGYYYFNLHTLLNICDIQLLQKAGLSLNQIKNQENYEIQKLAELYNTKYDEIAANIKELQNAQTVVKKQIEILNKIKTSSCAKITRIAPPFDYIYTLSILDNNLAKIRLSKNCNDISYDSKKEGLFFGISSNSRLTNKPFWKKSTNARFFKLISKQHNLISDNEIKYNTKPKNETGSFHTSLLTSYTENYISKTIIEDSPDKKTSRELLSKGKTTIQNKNLKEVMDNLTMLGYDIKAIIYVWLTNTCVKGVKYKFFDVYLEY